MQNNKASNEQAIPLLMPQQHMVLPHYMGQSRNIDIESQGNEVKHKDIRTDESFSFPSESIPLLLPQEANQVESESMDSNLNSFQCTGIDHIEIDSKDQTCKMIMEDGEFPNSDDWLNVQERSYQVASANVAAQVGPKTKCHCQVSFYFLVGSVTMYVFFRYQV